MALLGSCDEQDLREALERFDALGAAPAAAMARKKLRDPAPGAYRSACDPPPASTPGG